MDNTEIYINNSNETYGKTQHFWPTCRKTREGLLIIYKKYGSHQLLTSTEAISILTFCKRNSKSDITLLETGLITALKVLTSFDPAIMHPRIHTNKTIRKFTGGKYKNNYHHTCQNRKTICNTSQALIHYMNSI